MGERRDRRNPETGAPGAGSVRREPAGPDPHAVLPDLRAPGAGHPADGRVLRRGPARRGNGAVGPGLAGRSRAEPGRGPGSADAGDPATAGLPRPDPDRPARPADGGPAAAQRPARRARREAALGNQPVRARPVAAPAATGRRGHRATAHRRTRRLAAQAAPDPADGPGRPAAQPGRGDQPRLPGACLCAPGGPVPRGTAGAAVEHRFRPGRGPGQR